MRKLCEIKYVDIKVLYEPAMSVQNTDTGFSQSPTKPHRFLQYLKDYYKEDFNTHFHIQGFEPFCKEEFYRVHNKKYVNRFFSKYGDRSNGLDWSEELANSVRYTNSSLFHAISQSLQYPHLLSLSPTSGFHHATYQSGGGFCTFSGQVLASLKIYDQFQAKGCYVDLDGHYGNSIDSYYKNHLKKQVLRAIPKGCNINPSGKGIHYLRDLKIKLDNAMMMYLKGEIQYFVWCHGADSHIDDPLGTQLNPKQWLQCTQLFIEMINDITSITKSHVPISIALFGGYQRDFNKTLKLHQQDIDIFIKQLLIQK